MFKSKETAEHVEKPDRISKRHISKLRKLGFVAAGLLTLATSLDMFDVESTHKASLEVAPPETKVYKDVRLNLARVESKFGLTLDTSLDRPGPSNCDTSTRHTGKKGEDPKIKTTVRAGVKLDQLKLIESTDKSSLEAVVIGSTVLNETSVDYAENKINVSGASGVLDVCVGTGEVSSALNIVNTSIQHAGQIAAACALQGDSGREAFYGGVREFVRSTDLGGNYGVGDISVIIEKYEEDTKELHSDAVDTFQKKVGEAIDEYLAETDNHTVAERNTEDLFDCDKHSIQFVE